MSHGTFSLIVFLIAVGVIGWGIWRYNQRLQRDREGQTTETSKSDIPKNKVSDKEKKKISFGRYVFFVILVVVTYYGWSHGWLGMVTAYVHPAPPPLPADYNPGRRCMASERKATDLFEATVTTLPNREFKFSKITGCFAKVIEPGFSNQWQIQTLNPQKPTDWIAIACADGRIAEAPQLPNAKANFYCNGTTPKERNTFFIQTNTDLVFIAP